MTKLCTGCPINGVMIGVYECRMAYPEESIRIEKNINAKTIGNITSTTHALCA